MRRIFLIGFSLLFAQVPLVVAQKVDPRNYVIAQYDATPNEIRLADKRARARLSRSGGSPAGDYCQV
jgi:hypothetical protein